MTNLGPNLAQVLKLDQFASQLCSVSGPRRLVALVSAAQPNPCVRECDSMWLASIFFVFP